MSWDSRISVQMSSDRVQNDRTNLYFQLLIFIFVETPAGRPIFVETPAGYYVKFHFLPIFDQKNWVVGWCFPTHEIKMFKIQKNTFQMLLISSHLDIVGRFSAQMKFEQLSRILKKFRKTEKNWNLGLYTYPFAESSFHFIISYRGRKTMILASFESSRSIFFDSWKRYTTDRSYRPIFRGNSGVKKIRETWVNLV